MKSVERRFNELQKKNPMWSSLICFSEAIVGQGFKRGSINRHFSLVDNGDYSRKDRLPIINQLEFLTNLKTPTTKRKK